MKWLVAVPTTALQTFRMRRLDTHPTCRPDIALLLDLLVWPTGTRGALGPSLLGLHVVAGVEGRHFRLVQKLLITAQNDL